MSVEAIAKELLSYDISQIEYYESITNNMVGKVLKSHDVVEKNQGTYELIGYGNLTTADVDLIIDECNKKIEAYVSKRGLNIWEHRRRNRRAVPGTIRYEVLKRAKFRCELCGISADEKALEVDHILPKNHGGKDSINNYQALCYTCNAQKKDHDDTDFRYINDLYHFKQPTCVFCEFADRKIVHENNLAFSIYDAYPVTKGHLLILPKRHVTEYFDLHQAEINAVNEIIKLAKLELCKSDPTITGFNIGINNGEDAGQTILHCHIHLIPRRWGDVNDPKGGIRNTIPGMGAY